MSVILAFGDSITYGFGTEHDSSYPRQIERKTGLKVVNAGANGEESSAGLLRLPSYLKSKPEYVILCHGANDIYNRRSAQTLKSNLHAMIQLIKKSGAKILLVGVPNFGLLSNDIHVLYDELAEECDLLFEGDLLRNILTSNLLKVDYIHPNKDGYEIMANTFIEMLKLDK